MQHRTEYSFDRPVRLSPHIVRLRPSPHARTLIETYDLQVLPAEHFVNWQQDPFGNYLARYVFSEPTQALIFNVAMVAKIADINPFDFFLDESVAQYPFQYDEQLRHDLNPYLEIVDAGPLLKDRLAGISRVPRPTLDFLVEILQSLVTDTQYLVRLEEGVQSCEQTLQLGSGSCRDSAWLLVQLLRHCGVAARFVSGYLIQLQGSVPGPGALDTPEEDSADLHAWSEVYLPGAGWVGLDPTSALFAGGGHIPLAGVPSAPSAAAVVGTTSPVEVQLQFSNTLQRL